ncbi:hypothetical protein [Streptosporangium carneum]|uniref:Uncharacterized protein n=1 Tax=Streptosporangium carneum TaxID=47481 RepID=A0A9W6I255_9ACTN|nr:hypothetical protein [Streptosporangium carneum]GLK10312.1 hypothetical protein GCM10017600_37180 [Streptosporangium carneum]
MRTLSSMFVIVAAGAVVMTGTAHADSVNLTATVNPGAEVSLSPELVPTAPYKGRVLVKLDNNTQPTEVRIGNCHGRHIGKVAIAANDHAAYVAAADSPAPACVRFRVKNVGDQPVTVAGVGYF